eukprot:gene10303-8232_t
MRRGAGVQGRTSSSHVPSSQGLLPAELQRGSYCPAGWQQLATSLERSVTGATVASASGSATPARTSSAHAASTARTASAWITARHATGLPANRDRHAGVAHASGTQP